ncbi:DUF1684 domain-containing protein [Rubrobacter aplysinae]|uniref:DUF1684 domain-containing protein n=1 Tax=Rubrobacter aplysinae TaxID=909625 RepID=UPI00064B8E90|nr:DUF1684 domain-containing protein [Rubrobacter aplysinae]
MSDYEQLLDYRRRVAEMYARACSPERDEAARLTEFRRERDELFRHHSQSPLPEEDRAGFQGLDYHPYDPALRYTLRVEEAEPETLALDLDGDGTTRLRRFGRVGFELGGAEVSLSLFWIEGYGGGLLLPFRDATSGRESYGGGRYVLDTIKHADLGAEAGGLVVDFNYAYNPSCAYNPLWDCPLPPPENHLPVAVTAGEKAYGEI